MSHYIYKCKHNRTVSRCRCIKPHEIKIAECRAQECIRDEMKRR